MLNKFDVQRAEQWHPLRHEAHTKRLLAAAIAVGVGKDEAVGQKAIVVFTRHCQEWALVNASIPQDMSTWSVCASCLRLMQVGT